ncbi:MAG: endonuclease/exonuclease/phosphatase family protein [Pseudomonadota bacterium]
MKKTLLLILIVLITGCSQEPDQAACSNEDCLTIGSFNIRLFGNNGPADTQAEVDRLVAQIHDQAAMDVVVLQEINIGSSEWQNLLLPSLEAVGYMLSGHGNYGGASPDRQQFVVMLHKTDTIELLDEVTDLSNDTIYDDGAGCSYESVRSPTTAAFRSRTLDVEFRLYGVHLKSNRPVGDDEQCDNQIRDAQVGQILDSIRSHRAEDRNAHFIIAGDFNMDFAVPELERLRQRGYESAIQADCSAELLQNCTFLVPRFAGIIDHIAYSPSIKDQFTVIGQIGEISDNQDFLDTQSDHAPVSATFSRP